MANPKRIGILTSGGDCAGLNAVIRAVVRRATNSYGWEVLGIYRATQGLMNHPPEFLSLDIKSVDSILTAGGTILGTTNKGDPFAYPMPDGSIVDRSADIAEGYRRLGLDAIVGIGGDGSLYILRQLAQKGGMNLVGIPKTIDNDLGSTERSVGFDTAVNTATEALDRLHFTAASHSRVMILEVMGRDAGHIAISAGIAGGAHVILIPEIPYSLASVCSKIRERQERGQNFTIIIVAEAVKNENGETITYTDTLGQKRLGGVGHYLADAISRCSGAETRVTTLGHVQRGGTPSPLDRLLASAFGVAAVDLIADGKFDRMVAWQNRQIVDVPISEAIDCYSTVDPDGALVRTARGLGICLGS
ncbi:MAG: ATP-dependent 6-phosphofructokinase [Leptolyngbyaceae bacterium]|nr:ATP-dependent 6-phosphofructokinase [Leptolyngbyaceae bacterium]